MPEPKVLCLSFDRAASDERCATLKEAGSTEKYVLLVEAKEKSGTPVLLVCGDARESEIPATVRIYALEGSAGFCPHYQL